MEDLVAVAHRADAGRDLAQRALGVGRSGEIRSRATQLVDEARVLDRDGRLTRERAHEGPVGLVEGVPLLGIDLEDAKGTGLPRDRRGDHRVEPGPFVELRRLLRRRELRRQVVTGDDHPVLGDRHAGRADPHRDPEVGALLVAEEPAQTIVVRPAQVAGLRVKKIEDGAVRTDDAAGLLDHVLEDLGRVAEHRDPRGDLPERLLRIGTLLERLARSIQLLDEPRGGDRDRGLIGDRLDQRGVVLRPRVDPIREDRQRAERPRLAHEGRRQDRVDPGRGDERVGAVAVRERLVVRVVAGPERSPAHDGLPGDPLVERRAGRRACRRHHVLLPKPPKRLVGAFNGGFQALHGEFGMMAEGRVYLPPKPWAATVAVFEDGRVGMGSWPGPGQHAAGTRRAPTRRSPPT